MTTDALEPARTAYDRKVLGAIPKYVWRAPMNALSIWQIGEALETLDLDELRTELSRLVHLGYALETFSHSRGRRVYWRTRKGNEAVQ